MGVVDHEVRNQ
jgi:hypothetical protein